MVRLTIVLWNVDGDGTPKTRPKELREKTQYVLNSWWNNGSLPDILLAQQITSRIHDRLIRDFFEQSNQSQRDRSEATVYINNPNVESLDPGSLMRSNDRLPVSDQVPIGRMHACVLPVRGSRPILVVSWHGVYKTKHKIRLFQNLLRFVHQLMEDQSCGAFILGGDFNLDVTLARQALRLREDAQAEQLLGADTGRIDYMIVWPGDLGTLRSDVTTIRHSEFNHPIVMYQINIGETEESEESEESEEGCRESSSDEDQDDLYPDGGQGSGRKSSSKESSAKGSKKSDFESNTGGASRSTSHGAAHTCSHNSYVAVCVAGAMEGELAVATEIDRAAAMATPVAPVNVGRMRASQDEWVDWDAGRARARRPVDVADTARTAAVGAVAGGFVAGALVGEAAVATTAAIATKIGLAAAMTTPAAPVIVIGVAVGAIGGFIYKLAKN